MIKQLISDIAYGDITLSQALTRAKLVSSKIGNAMFSSWLEKELKGYKVDDKIPQYRKIHSQVSLTVEFYLGRMQTFPVSLPDNFDKNFVEFFNSHKVLESIAIIEQQIATMSSSNGVIPFPQQMVETIAGLYTDQIANQGGIPRSAQRTVVRVQYQNILEQTKQNLLDTLMEFENTFPNLINDYEMTTENNDKIQNIITNNIYGNNNPMNIASGQSVQQNDNVINIEPFDYDKFKNLGLNEDQIQSLKGIIEKNPKGSPTLIGEVLNWLSSVTASLAATGLSNNIPAITETIHHLFK